MGRRVFGIRDFVLVLTIALAIFASLWDLPRFNSTAIEAHYGAAASVETGIAVAAMRARHALGNLMGHPRCLC